MLYQCQDDPDLNQCPHRQTCDGPPCNYLGQSWLWPDHIISRRESRALREGHNALVNSHAELLEALRELRLAVYAEHPNLPASYTDAMLAAQAAIAKAEGG